MSKEKYARIGETALRSPIDGEYLPTIPLYVRARDIKGRIRGAMTDEETALREVGKLFAKKMKRYIEGGGLSEAEREVIAEREAGDNAEL